MFHFILIIIISNSIHFPQLFSTCLELPISLCNQGPFHKTSRFVRRYCQLRARRALLQFKDVSLRTRRVLLLYKVNSNSTLLALNWRYEKFCENAPPCLHIAIINFYVFSGQVQLYMSFFASKSLHYICVFKLLWKGCD